MTTQTKEKDAHAIQNAKGWSETITALVAAMNADFDRLEELRDERARVADSTASEDRGDPLVDWDKENGEELAELKETAWVDGEHFASADDVRERIQESALSVMVRGDWYTPGEAHDALQPVEFEILLTTGGPALRIRGELDEHCEPERAWLEYQDWGTPWTELHGEGAPSQDDLLTFASVFYFGE